MVEPLNYFNDIDDGGNQMIEPVKCSNNSCMISYDPHLTFKNISLPDNIRNIVQKFKIIVRSMFKPDKPVELIQTTSFVEPNSKNEFLWPYSSISIPIPIPIPLCISIDQISRVIELNSTVMKLLHFIRTIVCRLKGTPATLLY